MFIGSSKMSELFEFCKYADGDKNIQNQLSQADSCDKIIDIAQAAGFQISYETLRDSSSELTASYWFWSGKGKRFRYEFFKKK